MICIETAVQDYLDHLSSVRRVTDKTLKNYRSTCAAFASWAKQNSRGLDSDSLQAYVKKYGNASSANVALVRLVGLAKHAEVEVNVTRSLEEKRENEALHSSELASLLNETANFGPEVHAPTVLLSETGLRFDEFMRASTEHVRMSNGVRFLEVSGKGRKQRKVPLTDAAFTALQSLPERTPSFEKSFRKKLARAGKRAKLNYHAHPHLLRASFISIRLNERGIEAIKIAKVVGHSSVDTMLKHYYRADIDALAHVM